MFVLHVCSAEPSPKDVQVVLHIQGCSLQRSDPPSLTPRNIQMKYGWRHNTSSTSLLWEFEITQRAGLRADQIAKSIYCNHLINTEMSWCAQNEHGNSHGLTEKKISNFLNWKLKLVEWRRKGLIKFFIYIFLCCFLAVHFHKFKMLRNRSEHFKKL